MSGFLCITWANGARSTHAPIRELYLDEEKLLVRFKETGLIVSFEPLDTIARVEVTDRCCERDYNSDGNCDRHPARFK